jgi:hypothetical protein
MNIEVIFLLLILLLGIVLFSFLGSNYSREGLTNNTVNTVNTIYNGPNGATATILKNSDGTKTIKMKQNGGETILFDETKESSNTFKNAFFYGYTASISNGNILFSVQNGPTITFSPSSSNSSTNTSATTSSTSSTTTSSSSTTPISSNSFDNYNHFNGSGSSIQLQNGTVFTDASGNTITVRTNSNGTQNLELKLAISTKEHVFNSTTQNSYSATNTFKSASGKITAKAIRGSDGQIAIQVNDGTTSSTFLQPGSKSNVQNSSNITSTQYFGSTGYSVNPTSYSTAYGDSSKSSQNLKYDPNNVNNYGTTYYSALPPGIPKSQIPPGDEDLYILKSQIVPPVCPVCPVCSHSKSNTDSNGDPNLAGSAYGDKKCPPCPACARCPESAFECKKVPNYNAINNDYLPQPVLSDFSQFGM